MATYPTLNSFQDIFDLSSELKEACLVNKFTDHIYRIPFYDGHEPDLPKDFSGDKLWYIAGSSAVERFIHYFSNMAQKKAYVEKKNGSYAAFLKNIRSYLFKMGDETCLLTDEEIIKALPGLKRNLSDDKYAPIGEMLKTVQGSTTNVHGRFKPGDTDIFFINSSEHYRFQTGNIDFVYTKIDSVENLLLNFDLPCCRAGFNHEEAFYISAHCLYSILTGSYFLPVFLDDKKAFKAIMKENGVDDGNNWHSSSYLFERLHTRIATYQSRGFVCLYQQTTTIPSWILSRFHYAEWKRLKTLKQEEALKKALEQEASEAPEVQKEPVALGALEELKTSETRGNRQIFPSLAKDQKH